MKAAQDYSSNLMSNAEIKNQEEKLEELRKENKELKSENEKLKIELGSSSKDKA